MTNSFGNIYSRLDEVNQSINPINVVKAIQRAITIRNRSKAPKPLTEPDGHDLAGVVAGCHDELFKAKTVFPFTLFRNSVILDRQKVTVIDHPFLMSTNIISIPVRDLLNVEAEVGPFFGSIHLSSRYFATTPCSIRYLKRSDALRLQRLLQGYIISEEQKIDCSGIDKAKLVTLLNDLGGGGIDASQV